MNTQYPKKLIEVALPLPEINDASAYDKMPGIGPHPKGIHHWWARLPLPTARAILFASVVDDPSEHPERFPTEEAQTLERERLFNIVRSLMAKKLHQQPKLYAAAQSEMLKHCDGKLPAVYDPFSGGGSIPLEANRMGFDSHAADLNPVAVMLNKCNLELAPRWTGFPPVNPEDGKRIGGSDSSRGTYGLAADVRYYGSLIRDRARERIGNLYPQVRLPKDYGGGEANVIAWMWARTVASDNPAVKEVHVPLISTYWLSTAAGKLAWLRPIVDRDALTYSFAIESGTPPDVAMVRAGTKMGRGGNFRCILSGTPISNIHLKEQGVAKKLGTKLLAIVASVPKGKVYLPASANHESIANVARPEHAPHEQLRENARYLTPTIYGMRTMDSLFTPRQLVAMVTLSDLVKQITPDVERDAVRAGLLSADAKEYARTVVTFLALALDRCADFNCALSTWKPSGQQQMHLFTRQAISMAWDFVEANLLGEKAICWHNAVDICADAIESLFPGKAPSGSARQIDAATGANGIANLLVSTDPPYYDNVPYADIADFFYVWLRRTIGHLYPDMFATVLTPKTQELTAAPERYDGDKERAKEHFETGFRKAFTALRDKMDPRFPLTVYYAFKQDDEESGAADEQGAAVDLTTGWETLLEALTSSGFQITGTWPVRASQAWRMRAMGSNALASYIVLACRPRPSSAPLATRKEVVNSLRQDLPKALRKLQCGNIAPVDMAQAAIGPGMAIFTRYAKVIESDGSPMTVRTALGIINQVLDEVLAEQEGDFDADTRWALAWFEQFGMQAEAFGTAETLSRAKNTAINGLVEAGVVKSKSGKVQLVSRAELPDDWNPVTDKRLTVWETTQHLIRRLETKGEAEAATLLNQLGGMADTARVLAYRLFSICERKKWADEALAYNGLVIAWPELSKLALASRNRQPPTTQAELFT